MSKRKHQHYVPQFYLKSFANSKKKFSIINIKSRELIKDIPYTSQCYEDYMYGEDEEWEMKLQKLETKWAPLINEILANPYEILSKEQKILMNSFISFQRLRTTDSRDNTTRMKTEMFSKMTAITSQFLEEELTKEELRYMTNQFANNIDTRQEAGLCLKIAKDIESITLDLKMLICINKTNIDFISSDNPIVLINPFQPNHNAPVMSGLIVLTPLSPRISLLCIDEKIYPKSKNLDFLELKDKEDIYKMNLLQLVSSKKIVYAKNPIHLFVFNEVIDVILQYNNNIPATGISFTFSEIHRKAITFSCNDRYMFYRNNDDFDIQQRISLLNIGLNFKKDRSIKDSVSSPISEDLLSFKEFFENYMNDNL